MSQTLYQRLREAEGIRLLVDDVMAAHLANPLIKTRFENIKDLERAKRMAREFFGAGAGGPAPYTGKDMVAAHTGMNISEQEYLAATDDILGAMDKHDYDEETKKDALAIIYSLKNHIMRK